MIILGIETSCDETSVGIVEKIGDQLTIKANITATSLQLHSKTGGIIPEIAAREQIKFMLPVLEQAIKEAFPSEPNHLPSVIDHSPNIDTIAVTYGPGLIGSLLVGVETAKTLSYLWNKPLIPINHMVGHIYANWLIGNRESPIEKNLSAIRHSPSAITFPALILVVSGGHTDLLLLKKHGDYEVIGGTRDDAAGECFDKCARLLGYPYPGGPKIAQLAQKGNPKAYHLPRPMLGEDTYDFSFSGLKTAFFNLTKEHFSLARTEIPNTKAGWQRIPFENELSDTDKEKLYDLCASLQQAIVDVLVKKTIRAAEKYAVKSILLSGGVAANELLRDQMERFAIRHLPSTKVFAPAKTFCTDNGAMIAAAAAFNYNPVPWQDVTVDPELYY